MRLHGLLPLIEDLPPVRELAGQLGLAGKATVTLTLPDAATPAFLAALQSSLSRPLLIVTASPQRARSLAEEVEVWAAQPERVLLFADDDFLFYEMLAPDPNAVRSRLLALAALRGVLAQSNVLVIASALGCLRRLSGHEELFASWRKVRVGDRQRPDEFVAWLVRTGYEPAPVVTDPGTFARRGGIVDVFPAASESPFRIEFFGDEVESLRLFDPFTQRSKEQLTEAEISPPREVLANVGAELKARLSGLDLSSCREEVQRRFAAVLDGISAPDSALATVLAGHFASASLLEYLPQEAALILDDPTAVAQAAQEAIGQAEELRREMEQRGELPAGLAAPYHPWVEVEARFAAFGRALTLDTGREAVDDENIPPFAASLAVYGGRLKDVLEDSEEALRRGERLVIVTHQADRLEELFRLRGRVASPVEELAAAVPPGSLSLVRGSLSNGWRCLPLGLTLLTDSELFGWAKPRRIVRRRPVAGEGFAADIATGEYVVHVDHGVGRFQGLVQMPADGVEREYLVLEYAEGDRLYVPTDQADRVSRYVGVREQPPTVHRLGSGEWERAKERARAGARELAKELLQLYAARQVLPGIAFSPDNPWQGELEAAFPYIETPDQVKALNEVKADMEQARPMDRLLCGDVGYGKTEVALRAAFKAVMDGKQVAILVPTTVLAQQHYQTFTERLQAFPMRVEMLSRFRTEREQREILDGLAAAAIDICIGTHRLLQKDVLFKDLGLVVIDEEQRFGVNHKEHLKRLRTEVDVLTMSATPIPRTLYMSLAEVRDMSTMETPPEERLPIKTFIAQYDESLIREAILRELERGGQVYFLHNRVKTIVWVARRLAELVPEATVAIGHGQMPEEELEQVMVDFAAGKYDVLVCTTIIESGVDIPNVNTIMINDADRFGLAQLYQLRGRVGRGASRAYAYLLHAKNKRLTVAAEKRLRTIFEAAELGAGFRIALRDLEIRGAGNLLGSEQHGYVAAVGFDLYCRLLNEAVRQLQGKPIPRPRETTIDLPLDVYLPEDYVSDGAQRLALYRRFAAITALEEMSDASQELLDRFGPPPVPVLNLLYLLQVKALALAAEVREVYARRDEVVLHVAPGKLFPSRLPAQVRVGHTQLRIPMEQPGAAWRQTLIETLEALCPKQPAPA